MTEGLQETEPHKIEFKAIACKTSLYRVDTDRRIDDFLFLIFHSYYFVFSEKHVVLQNKSVYHIVEKSRTFPGNLGPYNLRSQEV